ncbi:MAG: HDOD domain-containing protein [Thiobacillus sp.]|nr:HDOD domain-containing protein [Thiobacillus sp.]
MLERFIRILMGKKARRRKDAEPGRLFASQREQAAFRKLNVVAPLLSELDRTPVQVVTHSSMAMASPPARAIVCREAVLGKNKRVAGYTLSLGYKINPRMRASSVSLQRVYDMVLVRNLQEMGIQRLLASRRAFVDVSASSLEMPFLEEPQPQGIVYVVGTNAQLLASHASSLAGLTRLRALGYRIGLRADLMENPDMAPFLERADFLFIDVGNSDIPLISDQIETAQKRAPAIRLVATNIQTMDEYNVCAGLPFAYYQGPFITSRDTLDAPKVDAGRLKILELLNKLRSDAETFELTALFKQNLALSYKLLRYINSPGMGLLHKMTTLEQALLVLGRQKFYRWLTLLLFTSGETSGLDWAVMENALIRARLAELLAKGALSAHERDELFVAGMFSLLDVVLSMPMEDVLKQVSLPPLVDEALLYQEGKYAPYLDLAIACEQPDNEQVAALAHAIGLDVWRVSSFHVDAMLWAQPVGE